MVARAQLVFAHVSGPAEAPLIPAPVSVPLVGTAGIQPLPVPVPAPRVRRAVTQPTLAPYTYSLSKRGERPIHPGTRSGSQGEANLCTRTSFSGESGLCSAGAFTHSCLHWGLRQVHPVTSFVLGLLTQHFEVIGFL